MVEAEQRTLGPFLLCHVIRNALYGGRGRLIADGARDSNLLGACYLFGPPSASLFNVYNYLLALGRRPAYLHQPTLQILHNRLITRLP
jgi:hypothetical protein